MLFSFFTGFSSFREVKVQWLMQSKERSSPGSFLNDNLVKKFISTI